MSHPFYTLSATRIADAIEPLLGQCATLLRDDVVSALEAALASERSDTAQRVLEQFLENARIARADEVPLCQDTGSVWVTVELDEGVCLTGDLQAELDAVVARVWEAQGLRASMVRDALLDRTNTGNNTPVFVDITYREASDGDNFSATVCESAETTGSAGPGEIHSRGELARPDVRATGKENSSPSDDSTWRLRGATVSVMLKGAGSDNASRVVMLSPAAGIDEIEQELVALVREKASAACPPLIIGVGIGATFDKVASLSKRALLADIMQPNPDERLAALEQRLLSAVNATGIGPGGLGGDTTALAVKVLTAPCHIAALPLALNLGCSALRSRTIHLTADKDPHGG